MNADRKWRWRARLLRAFSLCLFVAGAVSFCRAAEGPSKAVFAYGAINAYMTSTWVAREQGLFAKHSVELEPVFIIASRATAEAVNFIRSPANKRSVLQTMVKQLKLTGTERAEPFYGQLVEELPRNICPTAAGVRSILKLMVDLGINSKAAGLKAEDVIDLSLCKRLGGDGK